jgi:hypothetical protein
MRNDQKSKDELLSMAFTIAIELRMDAMRAKPPIDRSIAKAIGRPYFKVEQDRQIFGRCQSRLRRICLKLRDAEISAEAQEEQMALLKGFETIMYSRFGIPRGVPLKVTKNGLRDSIEKVYEQCREGNFGPIGQYETVERQAFELGMVIRGHER